MGKFKKGIFLGGLLGAGLTWLHTTDKGKQMRKKMLDTAADLYSQVEDAVKKSGSWEKMTKHEYVQVVTQVVNRYAVDNKLAQNVKQGVIKLLSSQWGNIKKDLKKGKKKK